MSDWTPYEQFVDQQVAFALAWMDSVIDEHEGEEREALLRQRPDAARKLEAQVRMAFQLEADQ